MDKRVVEANRHDSKSLPKEKQKKSKRDFKDKYFIRDVENLTGIRSYTIRIWEQRYGMLIPKRTETNIRYYDDEDVRYLMNVSVVNAMGLKISQIAKLSREEIAVKAREHNEITSEDSRQLQMLVNSMLEFDEREFNRILSAHMLRKGMEDTMVTVIFPFLQQVGNLWLSGSIHVAHEHFISNLIRQRLYVAIDQLPVPAGNGKKFILFVPNGEIHDLSLLFAAYLLRSRKKHVIYLGLSTPVEELTSIFELHNPDALFCCMTNANQLVPVEVYLKNLSHQWPGKDIYVTGAAVVRRRDIKLPANCKVIYNPVDFIKIAES